MVAVLAIDWALPLRGALTIGLALISTALVLPWTALLFSRTSHGSDLGRRVAQGPAWWLPRVVLLAAVATLFVAKWLVLQHSHATDPEYLGLARSYTILTALGLLLGLSSQRFDWATFMASLSAHPARLLATSFGATGLIGTLLLSLPIAHERLSDLSVLDNLFMAFSAVCVTGLAVNNLAQTYTLFGQGVLCLLVQIGGLGIMVLSAAIAMLVGQRLRVRSSMALTEFVDGASLSTVRRQVVIICGFTLLIEATGVFLLYLQFLDYPGLATRHGHALSGPGSALWAAVFHGVSAFCNAGFSNFDHGLVPFRGRAGVLGVLAGMILLGGIGFPVLTELARAAWKKLSRKRIHALSLHSRVTLRSTALLLAGLALGYLLIEWRFSFTVLTVRERFLTAIFQSVSARTAGFNVIDLSTLLPESLVLTCAAMFVGGASGSTAGGIKVTTAGALYAGLRAELTGHPPSLFNRVLPEAVIRKAIAVGVFSAAVVGTAFFLMLLVDAHPPLDLLFEVVSAFSTTGLSTGITPQLSATGKLVIIVLMFAGRIGPLTLALAVVGRAPQRALRYPDEPVLIG